MASAFQAERFLWFELCHAALQDESLLACGVQVQHYGCASSSLCHHLDLGSEQRYVTLVLCIILGCSEQLHELPGKGDLSLMYLGPALWPYSPQWCCCFGAFQHCCQEHTAERKGCTSLEGIKEHSYLQLGPKPFLLGLVMLWVFWRIGFDSEPEWTFLAFFPFCHPAHFRKSPDVGVCILSLSSLSVFVFQAWQQWKET